MRELKFRAWDTEKNEWADFVDIRSDGSVTTAWGADSNGRMVDEQFSGLHDANGAEIYEGDVVYIAGQGNIVVRWPFFELWQEVLSGNGDDIGVIQGNFFDNPELFDDGGES